MQNSGLKRTVALIMALVLCMLVFPLGAGSGEDEALTQTTGDPVNRESDDDPSESNVIYSEFFSLEGIDVLPAEEPAPLTYQGADYMVRLYPDLPLPEDAVLSAQEITDDTYLSRAAEQLEIEEKDISFLRVFDLSILSRDEKLEPEGPVRVEIDMDVTGDAVAAVHFINASSAQTPTERRTLLKSAPRAQAETLETTVEGRTVHFSTGSFSTFAIVGYTLEKRVLASDGNTYLITVTYGADAGLPEDADLEVTEIVPTAEAGEGETDYVRYLEQTEQALGLESGSIPYARFFDIHIVDAEGTPVRIAEGAAVQVSVRLEDVKEIRDPRVVHFGEQTEVMDSQAEMNTVIFAASGFSVYAVVDAPEPAKTEIRFVTDVSELNMETGFYLSYGGTKGINNYISSNLNNKSCFMEVGDALSAAVWYFEPAPASSSDYLLYTYVDGAKKYLKNTRDNLVGLTDDGGTPITIIPSGAEGKFYFKSASENKWLQHSKGGGGIRFYTDNNNADNSRIAITYAASYVLPDDPYGLDGQSYGIAYNDNSVTATGLQAQESGNGRLAAQDMLIRPDVLDHAGNLLVAQNTDISFWTFHNQQEDQYTLSTAIDGQKFYLVINGGSVSLTADASEASLITATPGTGANSGKWHFTAENGYSLNYTNNLNNGFNGATGSGVTTWLNLVERAVLTDEDFHLYTAKKVSVSDHANVYDGQRVVIYTRIWNDTTKQYEFYAVDHDGTLVRCYDTGDNIQWIGSQVNTALWDFTEYFDNGSPSYFYELRNTQYGRYIAPQVTGGQILSGSPIGINLNGRRYEENNTTIIAWDDANYAYVGLKTADGHVIACPLSEAEDFYFAVVNPIDPSDHLTTVATVDNNAYGITMKMVDFNNPLVNERDSFQNPFFGARPYQATSPDLGLLSTDLAGDGYPNTTEKTGGEKSLGNLFSGMKTVNHLFLSSIHNESGYFEYDSTQNFAHLNDDGTFTVYDQIGQVGTSDTQGDSGATRTHGQFMPYNDLVAGRYSTVTNQTDVLAHELPDVEPRKGEKLYLIPKSEADYFFGMEVSASFTQTPSGLDAWGHDIIFEFSGDDDFWLYVDGELVLDLGGVHQALTGSVNFRTGVVKNAGTTTSLYEVFRKNYQTRGLSTDEINEKLEKIFTRNENGQYVFKDYTNHDMKIFYMERGAGASNLHMRFNLAAVKPGTFILSKKLSGTEQADNDLIEFPYQIFYKTREDGESVWHQLTDTTGSVVYEGSSRKVTYLKSFTPAGGTEPYAHVFMLKPGEAAEVTLPDGATEYYVVECGVNPDIYDAVRANDTLLTGRKTQNLVNDTARQDFETKADTLENRTKVEYDNHVWEGAMRTLKITKKLYYVDGKTLLHYPENETEFNFRLYLGGENANPDDLPLASLYDYCIRDGSGNYCRWDADTQRFVSLGKHDYSTLTDAEKEAATFTTSMYGSVSKIPADYTVEVRNLILGTQYKVEERNNEIPRGYTLRSEDGYTRVDGGREEKKRDTPYTGSILRGEDPEIEIRNQKGWGLTVRKVWTDRGFMAEHDDVYFAVYIRDGDELTLYDGSVRRLKSPETEVYLFFEDLKYDGCAYAFSDFEIREVKLTGDHISVDESGAVSGYETITYAAEGKTMTIGGTPIGKQHQSFDYTVHYEVGESTGHNENIRTDTVTNSRPGITLVKTDLEGESLSGAVFTLKDENGQDVALPSYTSAGDGLITEAYLAPGVYTLTETEAPKGYVVLDHPIIITIVENNSVRISPNSDLYSFKPDESGAHIGRIMIQNRTTGLVARKKNAITEQPLANVHFALYQQVTQADGTKRKDYRPMAGYEDLVTDQNGIIPRITAELPAGTYYLEEKIAAEGFALLEDDLCFTIGTDGTVSLENHQEWLTVETVSGSVSYLIWIPNGEMPEPAQVTVSGKKKLVGRDMEKDEFTFTLTPIDINGAHIGEAAETRNAAGAAGEETGFSFTPISYTLDDYSHAAYYDQDHNALFYYLVEESIPDEAINGVANSISYSTAKFLVVVRLSYQDGKLSAAQTAYLFEGSIPEREMPAAPLL